MGLKEIRRLHKAARDGDLKWLRQYVATGGDVNARDSKMGFTPLTSAVEARQTSAARLLLDAGADVELPVQCPFPADFNGASPLMIACCKGPLEMVELLLKHGADVSRENPLTHFFDPIQYSVRGRDVTVARRLLKAGAKALPSHLYSSVIHGPPEMVQELINAKCDVAYTSSSGQPTIVAAVPMRSAAVERGKQIVQLLLAAGADPNAEGRGGETPLVKATRYNLPSMIEFLVAKGAKVDRHAQNSRSTPLHCAAELGHIEATEVLLKLGAPLSAKDKRGRTPYDVAKAAGEKKILKLLKVPQALLSSGPSVAGSTTTERRTIVSAPNKALKPKKRQTLASSKRQRQSFGVSNFLDFVDYWGHPTWVIIAVESSVESTVNSHSTLCTHRRGWRNAPVRLARKKDNVMAPLVSVVKPTECKWSLIYRVVCSPLEDFEGLMHEARAISARLKTRTLAFSGHDTSGAMDFFLYEDGEEFSQHSWESRNDPSEKHFAQLELYVPACYPRQEGKETWLAVMESSLNRIERVDIIEIAEL